MDNKLTTKVKEYAYSLGADIVGIAPVSRYENAPIKMSPLGLLPSAKSVVVCAIHHPDAVIELDGEVHPQIMGPYTIQYTMNSKLDLLSFKIGRMLEDMGYATVPIASSNIWRYRGYKDLDAVFAPDISHIYGAVCAGLGELGWHGMCMTPEYGARNRFVSIITEAELEPTPMYNGEKLCDMCGECIRNCPTDAYRKEVKGTNDVVIENKHHIFANKNLWRCAWGEHFDLDLDLPIPDVVDETTLLNNIKKHGARHGEFGVCLKVCLPKKLRQRDPNYSKITARRKRHSIPNDVPVHSAVYDTILSIAKTNNLDNVHFLSSKTLAEHNIPIKDHLPDGISAILLTDHIKLPCEKDEAVAFCKTHEAEWRVLADTVGINLSFAELDISRELEKIGYTALPKTYLKHDEVLRLCGEADESNIILKSALILTSAPFEDRHFLSILKSNRNGELKAQMLTAAKEAGADIAGVASADSIDSIAEQLREIRKDEVIILATDKNPRMMPFDPVISKVKRKIFKATDIIPEAKSVLVLGLNYNQTPVDRLGKPPAEAVGPYVFVQYEANKLLSHIGYEVCKTLQSFGYKAFPFHNLTGAGSVVGSPRGYFADATCNALEAVAAGLGSLCLNGSVNTEENGIHQRFVAIVTDADIEPNRILPKLEPTCMDCKKCLTICPTRALEAKNLTSITIAGETIPYLPVDINRCDWASKYALVKDEGNKFGGNETDIPCPDEITPENLAAAVKQQDNVLKFRPTIGEPCVVVCPLAKIK